MQRNLCWNELIFTPTTYVIFCMPECFRILQIEFAEYCFVHCWFFFSPYIYINMYKIGLPGFIVSIEIQPPNWSSWNFFRKNFLAHGIFDIYFLNRCQGAACVSLLIVSKDGAQICAEAEASWQPDPGKDALRSLPISP